VAGNLALKPTASGASVIQPPSRPALLGATTATGVAVSTTVGASVGVTAGVAGAAGAEVAGAGVALDEPQAEKRNALPRTSRKRRRTEGSIAVLVGN
jgi:hypothetical protein